MVLRTLLLGVVLSVGPSAAAQQPGPETTAAVKEQVTRFEEFLKMAIKEAGQQLARQADTMQPARQTKVLLQFDAPPAASGVIVPGVGPVFTVQIPGILPSNLALLSMWAEFRKPEAPRSGTPVGTSPDRVAATGGLPAPDAMTASPVVDPVGEFDPTRAYTTYAREKLIDALLDLSGGLLLTAGERVVIVAMDMLDVQPVHPTQLTGRMSRQLILTIKSEDLLALRQGKITREEAKQKIVDTRF